MLLKRECERKVIHRYVLYMSFTGDRISSDQVVINLTRDLNAEFFQKKKSLAKTQKKLEGTI